MHCLYPITPDQPPFLSRSTSSPYTFCTTVHEHTLRDRLALHRTMAPVEHAHRFRTWLYHVEPAADAAVAWPNWLGRASQKQPGASGMSGQWPSERSRGIPPCATHAWCLPPPRLRHSTVATYKAAQDGLVGAHPSHAHAGVARRPTQACHPSRFRGASRHRPKSGADVLKCSWKVDPD